MVKTTLTTDTNPICDDPQSRMNLLPGYYKWIYGTFRRYLKGCVVELGSGAGLGIATYIGRVRQVYAVDFDGELLDRARRSLPMPPLIAVLADLQDDWRELDRISADAVLLMDVLEHFEDDLTILKKAANLCKLDGYLVVKVPAQSAMFSPMDRASGHFRRYDPEDIDRLAGRAGLEIVRIRQVNKLGALTYSLKNRKKTNFSKSFSTRQLKIINVGLPLVRLFDLLPGMAGLSLVAVMKRKLQAA